MGDVEVAGSAIVVPLKARVQCSVTKDESPSSRVFCIHTVIALKLVPWEDVRATTCKARSRSHVKSMSTISQSASDACAQRRAWRHQKKQNSTRGLPMDWAKHGVKIVHSDELDLNTPQTSGMTRAAAITQATAGASKLWAGTMVVPTGCQDRTASPWRTGDRALRGWRAEFECDGAINWN
jgi:hypothetical protein